MESRASIDHPLLGRQQRIGSSVPLLATFALEVVIGVANQWQ
jgi:hypothetical protein